MLIHRVSAEWEDRSQNALELRKGLNRIRGRGEVGSADWPGVFLAALFGTADGGELSRAELDCQSKGRRVILLRGMNADAPSFQASDEDGNAVEDFTAENAGETLTGVSGEVYERLACLLVDTPPDSGGAGPEELQARIDRAQARVTELEQQEMALNQELRGVDGGQASENLPDLSVLTAAYSAMKQKLEADHVPELDSIARLRGAIINIMTAGKQLDKAEAEQEAAERVLSAAKADVDAMPFAGMTPEEAEQSVLKLPFRPFIPKWLAVAFGVAVVIGAVFLFQTPPRWYPLGWFAFVSLGLWAGWMVKTWGERWEVEAARRRNEWESNLVRYAELYRVMEEAQAAADIKIAAADSLRESLSTNERGILREIHRFAPEVSTMQEADEQLRLCARRRKELAIAEAVVRKAETMEAGRSVPALSVVSPPDGRRVVLSNLSKAADSAETDTADSPTPDAGTSVTGSSDAAPMEREKLIRTLNALREEREALLLEIRRDREELAEKKRVEERQAEHVPVSIWDRALISLETLKAWEHLPDDAFPKDLAPRTVEIFHALTDGQYLERKIFTPGRIVSLFSGAEGSTLRKFLETRDALDSFCFAVCLACFERVLSGDERPPLFLRGLPPAADENYYAASMRFLETMALDGQIVLFTG